MPLSPEFLTVVYIGYGRRDGAGDRIVEFALNHIDRLRSLDYSAFTLSRTRRSASSNTAAHGSEASGSRQTAANPASASASRRRPAGCGRRCRATGCRGDRRGRAEARGRRHTGGRHRRRPAGRSSILQCRAVPIPGSAGGPRPGTMRASRMVMACESLLPEVEIDTRAPRRINSRHWGGTRTSRTGFRHLRARAFMPGGRHGRSGPCLR